MHERPVLYSFRRCPYAMRARMALIVAGIDVRVREIILRDKPAEMLAASPKGSVPVLILPAGDVIDESLDVMAWALGQCDPHAMRPRDAAARTATEALIATNDGAFKHHLDRYKYATRYDDVDPGEHRDAGSAILWDLDGRLTTAPHLGGPTPGQADLAIFPFVRQFRIADPEWFDAQSWTGLKAWLAGWLDHPLFRAAMVKYPLWRETGEEGALLPPTP